MVEEFKTDRLIRDIWTQHTPDQFITIERAPAYEQHVAVGYI